NRAEVLYLKGRPDGKTGITLGGAPIGDDGSWNGAWKHLKTGKDGKWIVSVPASSAAIVRFFL
ncbi:MAG: hypothetical protein ACREE6_17025, partial [Limisphaerales bacterium]